MFLQPFSGLQVARRWRHGRPPGGRGGQRTLASSATFDLVFWVHSKLLILQITVNIPQLLA